MRGDLELEMETARLRLRPSAPDDVSELHLLWTDAGVRRYLWDDEAIPRERAAEVVAASRRSFAEGGFGLWVLQPRDGAEIIGFCGLRRGEYTHGQLELLCGLLPRYWGRGLAAEACRAVLDHAFRRLACERVLGITDAPNTASVRLMERLGMRYEHTLPIHGRESLVYSARPGESGSVESRVYTAEPE